MRLYETMYVVHPALESGRLDDIINEVEKTLTSCGGEKKAVSYTHLTLPTTPYV